MLVKYGARVGYGLFTTPTVRREVDVFFFLDDSVCATGRELEDAAIEACKKKRRATRCTVNLTWIV